MVSAAGFSGTATALPLALALILKRSLCRRPEDLRGVERVGSRNLKRGVVEKGEVCVGFAGNVEESTIGLLKCGEERERRGNESGDCFLIFGLPVLSPFVTTLILFWIYFELLTLNL